MSVIYCLTADMSFNELFFTATCYHAHTQPQTRTHTHSSPYPTHTDLALRETQAMLRAGSEGPVRGLTWLRSWDCLAPKIAYSVLARELLLYPDKVQGGDALYVLLLVRTVHSSPLPPTPLPLCSLPPCPPPPLSTTLSLSV